jgi:hypothetical protein
METCTACNLGPRRSVANDPWPVKLLLVVAVVAFVVALVVTARGQIAEQEACEAAGNRVYDLSQDWVCVDSERRIVDEVR